MQDLNQRVKKVNYGKVERMSFSRVPETTPLPYLLEVQKKSYREFIDKGIRESLEEYSPIVDYNDKAEIHFVDYRLDENVKYSIEECKKRRQNYSVGLKVLCRFINKETGEVAEQEVFLGDIPKMTDAACFIVNGVERVVVSQIVKSPMVYFDETIDKSAKKLISANLHTPRGTRLSMEQNAKGELKLNIHNSATSAAKVSLTTFLKACSYSEEDIANIFGRHPLIMANMEQDKEKDEESALLEIARKTRPSEVPSASATKTYINDTFFSNTYYNFGQIGRFKYNKKLGLKHRIANQIANEDILIDNEVYVKAGEKITPEQAENIQDNAINAVTILFNGKPMKIIGNNRVNIEKYVDVDAKSLGIKEDVYYPLLKEILEENETEEDKVEAIKENARDLITTRLTIDDIISVINYMCCMYDGYGEVDVIDHLANRRIAAVGELLENEFKKGLSKLKDSVREAMQSHDLSTATPATLISARPVNKFIRDFLASGQLSQITEDFNPLSTMANKRRISAVGPGGIKKERAGAEARDIHYSHYGRICAIETPEGDGIGLINGLAAYAKINDYGFIETPYRKVDKENGRPTDEVVYMMADEEEKYFVCQAVEPLNEDGTFKNSSILCRNKNILVEKKKNEVDYMDVSPRQFISAITSCVPFLENTDTVRALTASNMQRQAVPLLEAESPIIATGMEHKIAMDSGAMVISDVDGVVKFVDGRKVVIACEDGSEKTYTFTKFAKTNKETCYNQKPIVKVGENVKVGDVLADGFSTKDGELALGKNLTIAFMNWEGYNYEDAILVNEKLVKEDTLTSIVLKVEECSARQTKLGEEEITREIPNVSEDLIRNLDDDGIVVVGSEVKPGDYLVGKVTPKGETDYTPEERLLKAIFGDKAREVRDTSLKVPHGCGGTVVDVQIYSKKNKDELDTGVTKLVKVFIAKKRKISIGDKMAGRYGNKGVVSRVLSSADMPYLADGTPVDVVLNPLGVPSRMNIGQILEVHLGLIGKYLGWKIATPSFNGATGEDIQALLKENKLPEDAKFTLYDGRTGEEIESKVTVGTMYMIKLEHMSENKVHARSIGGYALVTRQPLGGKAMFGGQKLGEMEAWALEAYGASHLLQEMLTVKSDDVTGRTKVYENIVKGEVISEPGVPEAFKVVMKELQALGLDIKILTENNQELELSEITDEPKQASPIEVAPPEEVELDLDEAIDEETEEVEDEFADGEDNIFDFFENEDDIDE